MSAFTFISGLFLMYVFINELRYSRRTREELRFLESFDEYLGRVRHFYYFKGSVNDAIFCAVSGCDRSIRNRMQLLLNMLEKADSRFEESEQTYQMHRFEKILLSLARAVNENGDATDGNGSVFVRSLMQLRNDVQDQKRYLNERKHRFTGLSLTAALPVAAIPFVAAWATDTLPSLVWFYYGWTGGIVRCILLGMALAVYRAVVWLRSGGNPYEGRNIRIKAKSIRVISMCIAVAVAIPVLVAGHAENRKLLREDVSDIGNLCDTADSRQQSAMERLIPKYVKEMTELKLKAEPMEYSAAELSERLLNEQGIRTEAVADAAAQEIIDRTKRYFDEKFNLADVLIVILIAVGAYFIPAGADAFRNAFTVNRKQDEVLMFQSLIHMQKDVPGMSPVMLLESMERHAVCFKSSLSRCLNEYNADDIGALEKMAQDEDYPGFRRITDCFLAVDEAGMESAFEEISDEIVNFRENRKLERMILLDNDALLASVLAVIPGSLILFGYLLIPFMVKSLAMFDTYQDSLSTYIRL